MKTLYSRKHQKQVMHRQLIQDLTIIFALILFVLIIAIAIAAIIY